MWMDPLHYKKYDQVQRIENQHSSKEHQNAATSIEELHETRYISALGNNVAEDKDSITMKQRTNGNEG
jgi:hypothetical protein